ncbi:MAG: sigma-70 family RNA polymerase sigma factor [Rhizobiaceae bacterium]|nr:sigma-70 family RNA polymerase sigma factor [Rhizobiaceae bacterium]
MTEEDTADEVLLARIAQGDKEAMHDFYRRHRLAVFRFVLRIAGDATSAEDVANDVFIDVYRQAARFEGRSRVTTWLLGIARFKALSERRRRRETADVSEFEETIADGADSPEIVVQKQSKADALRRCIAMLSAEHREVIDLVFYHGRSLAEIAEIAGVPENTVKTRAFHARRRLAELLTQAGIDRGWP